MKNIPITESALIIRTDFSDQSSWDQIVETVQQPDDPFIFNMEFLDDHENNGVTVEQLIEMVSEDYPHSFLVVVDNVSISQSDHPLLIVDMLEVRGRRFRSLPAQVPSVENNLSIGNMGFEEFANAVDVSGVFRGFSNM